MTRTTILMLAFALAATGCASLDYTELKTTSGATPKDPRTIEVDVDKPPSCNYDTVAAYEANRYGTASESMAAMREDAAKKGFDGLYDFHCALPGTVGYDIRACTSKAYVCLSGKAHP